MANNMYLVIGCTVTDGTATYAYKIGGYVNTLATPDDQLFMHKYQIPKTGTFTALATTPLIGNAAMWPPGSRSSDSPADFDLENRVAFPSWIVHGLGWSFADRAVHRIAGTPTDYNAAEYFLIACDTADNIFDHPGDVYSFGSANRVPSYNVTKAEAWRPWSIVGDCTVAFHGTRSDALSYMLANPL